jgi:hypothetical protein
MEFNYRWVALCSGGLVEGGVVAERKKKEHGKAKQQHQPGSQPAQH